MNNLQEKWDESYKRRDNFVFYPHEEVIRFFAKYICKRVGLDEVEMKFQGMESPKVLDLGCGIGRHIAFSNIQGIYFQISPNFRKKVEWSK